MANDDHVRLWSLKRVHVVCSGLRASRVAQIGDGAAARFFVYRVFFRDVTSKLDPTKLVRRWVVERTPIRSPDDTRSHGEDVEVGVFSTRTSAEDSVFIDASKLGRFGMTRENELGAS
jgi:hypothetical protein